MTLITTFTLFLSLSAVSLATGAWLVMRRGSEASLLRRYEQLSIRLESIELLSEKLSRELRNDRASRNMAAGRARAAEEYQSSVPDETEKARVRRELGAKLARGMMPLKPAG